MKILIIYATSEGQTKKIAEFMEQQLKHLNYDVILSDVSEDINNIDIYDTILIGASVHMFSYQKSIQEFVLKNHKLLNSKHSAFFSVSMTNASTNEEDQNNANSLAKSFFDNTLWKPNEVMQFAGALKFTKYGFFKRLIMKLISSKKGETIDTSKDYEYTDWSIVKTNLLKFIKKA